MKYRLVTTKNGQTPLNEVEEGTEVLSHGNWVKAPKPIEGNVITCRFNNLPTTSFEKEFILNNEELYCNHKPILNKFEKADLGLTIRGYFHETKKGKKDSELLAIKNPDVQYWYPRIIAYYDCVVFPTVTNGRMVVYHPTPKLKELCGNELSERNLEYYLEGILRKRMFWQDNTFKLPENLDETDRIVLRLLDINCIKISLGNGVTNPVSLLKHIKDDYNKSRITEEMIRTSMYKSYDLPQYTPGCKIIEKKEETDWILPGINPDINCLSPWKWEDFDNSINPQVQKAIKTTPVDKLGKVYSNYNYDNIYEKLLRGDYVI